MLDLKQNLHGQVAAAIGHVPGALDRWAEAWLMTMNSTVTIGNTTAFSKGSVVLVRAARGVGDGFLVAFSVPLTAEVVLPEAYFTPMAYRSDALPYFFGGQRVRVRMSGRRWVGIVCGMDGQYQPPRISVINDASREVETVDQCALGAVV